MNKHTNRRMLVDSMKNQLDIEQQINRETRNLYDPKPGAAREERPRFPFREPGPPQMEHWHSSKILCQPTET